ncbi:MAG: aldolase/citrate lyase family protein [Acidobacteriota bacterium]
MHSSSAARVAGIVVALALAAPSAAQSPLPVLAVWAQQKTAFGIFVPNENPAPRERGAPPPKAMYSREGGERLAAHPLYDFVFLNMEGSYDAAGIKAIAEGLRSPKAVSRKALLVRVPTVEAAGADAVRGYIREAFALGADGVTVPHIRSVDEAKLVLGFFKETGVNIWSPANPRGDKLAMLMLEDPGAVAQAAEIAGLRGYSILACGIGSLTAALNGDRAAAEAGNQQVLAATKQAKLVNMLTASPQDVAKRVGEGFLALLGQGPAAEEMITLGRQAAGR